MKKTTEKPMQKKQKYQKTMKKQKKTKPHVTTRRNHIFREKMIKKFESVKLRCSPKTAGKGYTCLEDETLYKLKELWNARHPESKIDKNDSKEIWNALTSKLKGVCNKESCWLKQKFVNGKLDKELASSFSIDSGSINSINLPPILIISSDSKGSRLSDLKKNSEIYYINQY
jgi:hypothetical protein